MSLSAWKVLSSKILHKTPWIQVVADLCEHDDKKFEYTYVRRIDEGPLIIPEDEDGGLWLVQQYRHPVRKIIWQFPGEGKKKNESWQKAAQRGLREEIGKEAKILFDLGEFVVDPGLLAQKSHFYLAQKLKDVSEVKKHKQHESEVEDLRPKKFRFDQIDKMIESGEICDNWTLEIGRAHV